MLTNNLWPLMRHCVPSQVAVVLGKPPRDGLPSSFSLATAFTKAPFCTMSRQIVAKISAG